MSRALEPAGIHCCISNTVDTVAPFQSDSITESCSVLLDTVTMTAAVGYCRNGNKITL